MTTMNLNLEINYKEGAGHYLYIYTIKGKRKNKMIHYEILKFTTREKAEEYKQTLKNDKELYKEFQYLTISKEIVWID